MKNISRKRRMIYLLMIAVILFTLLIIRIFWLQFISGDELQTLAYEQQTLDRKVNPRRGTIYDSNMTELAVSSTVYTVTVNPTNIEEKNKEIIAKKICEIFDLDYEKILKRIKKRSSIETIVRKEEKENVDKLNEWLVQNNLSKGINIDEDTKRYYPYNNFASHIIGFCGSDNQGLGGVEAKYDSVLQGTKGRITKVKDASGKEVEGTVEEYQEAIDGKDIVMTIDMGVQSIAEKYLELACIDNKCTDGGNVVIMEPKTGNILAMATYPTYNLNDPYTVTDNEIAQKWQELSNKEKNEALQAMWRNKAIADTYEPGSTFKLVTTSASLEEGITTTDKAGEFCCTGSITIAGVRIKCWRHYRPHGSQSLRQALMNSCNPIFIGLGQKLGVETYYTYLERFGFLSKTGIDLPGEAKGIFLDKSKVGPVELATISFGQRFEVTPIQMITMVSTIANGGNRMKPRLVKEIIDTQTGEKNEINPECVGRAISKETAESVLSMMESVVAEGTGKNAKVAGYRVGGKTGTSEDGVNTNKYVTSFVGVAPISEPKVAILVTLYNPTGEGGHQGGAWVVLTTHREVSLHHACE
jgi:stage V sporulation protein D (sporulation-specific penicillin-binding protein)